MLETIYSKYSTERSARFQIRTDILSDNQGHYAVQKQAMSEKSVPHIMNTAKMGKYLDELYRDSVFEFNKYTIVNNATLQFEFIKGTTLELVLDQYLQDDCYDDFLAVLDRYKQDMLSVCNEDFRICPDFQEVFGNCDLTNLKALPAANVDQIFQNIIVADKRWIAYDYEWSFPFPIPVKYIFYRCALYYGEFDRKSMLSQHPDLDLYRFFDLSYREKQVFAAMEYHFQSYIIGEHAPLWTIYRNMNTKSYDCRGMALQKDWDYNADRINVRFVNQNNDVTECRINPEYDASRICRLTIDIPENTKEIILTPGQLTCMVKILDLSYLCSDQTSVKAQYTTNGEMVSKSLFCFPNGNAAITLQRAKDMRSLHVKMSVKMMESHLLESCADNSREMMELQKQVQFSASEKNALTYAIGEYRQEISDLKEKEDELLHIQASTYWKVTEPIRKTIHIARRIRQHVNRQK